MLGDVEETIYVVEDEENDEDIKVRRPLRLPPKFTNGPFRPSAESLRCCSSEVGECAMNRLDLADSPQQEIVWSSFLLSRGHIEQGNADGQDAIIGLEMKNWLF